MDPVEPFLLFPFGLLVMQMINRQVGLGDQAPAAGFRVLEQARRMIHERARFVVQDVPLHGLRPLVNELRRFPGQHPLDFS